MQIVVDARNKYAPVIVAALFMCLALLVVYPYCKYYIDPDGTAYLTISQRYANGEFFKAVNGLWSPLTCWFTALLIKLGMAAVPASWLVNSFGAAGFLVMSHSLFLKFGVDAGTRLILSLVVALFLCFAVFWQSFADLWECFLLLGAFRILLADSFAERPFLWVLYGAVGALAYFAKAYAFPFFMLSTFCCLFVLFRKNKIVWFKIMGAAVVTIIVLSIPWVCLLHEKYGRWNISTAGPLNIAWFLVGHPYWRQGIDLLLPPVYRDSPSVWEDPWFVNGIMPHFWDSWHLAWRELLRIGFNVYKLGVCLLQISIFLPVIAVLAFRFIWQYRRQMAGDQFYAAIVACMLLPIGYFFAAFESRYLWYLLPFVMIMGIRFINHLVDHRWRNILIVAFSLSFLAYPAMKMKTIIEENGKTDYETGLQLKKLGIHGSFVTMALPGIQSHRVQRVAYFSGCQLYSFGKAAYTQRELLQEMQRYHVQYFFVYDGSAAFTLDEAKSFPEITHGRIPGLKVYQVNP